MQLGRILLVLMLSLPSFGKVFPATADSVPAENRRADEAHIKRYETEKDVQRATRGGELLLLPNCSPSLKKARPTTGCYARRDTVDFVRTLIEESPRGFREAMQIDSATRSMQIQQAVRRVNKSAAPADPVIQEGEMSYLIFGEGPTSASGLTKSWYVSSTGSQLGYVKWYAPWRKYCYFPAQDIILDEHCLADIAGFCRTETILHKEKS